MAKKKSRAKKTTRFKAAIKTASKISAGLEFSQIWPQERDVLYRPERLRYVRKLIKTDGCVFCAARDVGPSLDSLCVYKNKHAMLILNKYPYNSGHVMVLPTRHIGDLCELSEEEHLDVQKLLRRTVRILKKEYHMEGFNIGLNMGKIAGAGIPEHLHWHIIPRWLGDTNFFPLIAETKVLAQTLEQVYEKLAPHYKGTP